MVEKPKSCWLYKNNLISIQKSPKYVRILVEYRENGSKVLGAFDW